MLFSFFSSQLVLSQGNEECLYLILNISDWKETPMTKWDYQKEGKRAAVLYLGAEHMDDPHHNQFEKIRTQFEKFKPAVVFFEGPDRGVAGSDTATIRQFGESGYTRWLAKQAAVPVFSLEPSFADLYSYLLSKFPQDQVDLYMYTREASRLFYRKKMDKEQVLKVISQMMATVPAMTGENKPMLVSLPMVESAYKKHFASANEWWQVPPVFFDPAKTGSEALFTNELAALSSAYRNIYMVQKLAEHVNAGKRVFAVVGKNHVRLQALALDCAIK
jgi:hypothetical protein